jgi:hypothetical protein
MTCSECQEVIPKGRLKILPETKVCVDCSTAEAVSCVDVVYHKTGNTIQIMDKQSADKINKLAKRSGFGIMSGMKGSSGGGTDYKNIGKVSIWRVPTEDDYQSALKRIGEFIDLEDRDKALRFVQNQYDSKLINAKHTFNLNTIIKTLLPLPIKEEVFVEDEKVDDEITHTFRNWKNSKVYK